MTPCPLAEETHNTEKTLPKAIFLTALISGLIFIAATYFLQLYFPGDPKQYFKAVDETQPEILYLVGGALFKSVVLAFAIVTVMASGIAAHAGVSRLMYVMGRDGVIHKRFFGHIDPKTFTPSYNILLVGAVALTAGFLSLEYVVALISFGALTAFSFVNLSVLAEYVWRQGRWHSLGDVLRYVVTPVLGFMSVGAMWLEVEPTSLTSGLIWGSIGLAYLGIITGGFAAALPSIAKISSKIRTAPLPAGAARSFWKSALSDRQTLSSRPNMQASDSGGFPLRWSNPITLAWRRARTTFPSRAKLAARDAIAAALASALAWQLARLLWNHPRPAFAVVTAVICLAPACPATSQAKAC